MVAHAFHRIAAPLQCLAQQLRLLELRGVDLARIEAAGEIPELLGRVVLAVAETLGDDMEAVDEAPGEVARERLEPRVAKLVEQRRHHPLHRSEESRVGTDGVCTCRSRWTPWHTKENNTKDI